MLRELQGAVTCTQFTGTPENAEMLRGLSLPTGMVTVQVADSMNRVEARAYVPTSWGTIILSPGDWILVTDYGYVLCVPNQVLDRIAPVQEQEPEETIETFDQGTELAPELTDTGQKFVDGDRAISPVDNSVENLLGTPDETLPALQLELPAFAEDSYDTLDEYILQHRLDWGIEFDLEDDKYVLYTVATGKVLARWFIGDTVKIYSNKEVVVRAAEPRTEDSPEAS